MRRYGTNGRKWLCGSFLAVSVAFAAQTAFAANNYIVPWYANPTVTNVTYSASAVKSPEDYATQLSAAQTAVSGDAALSGKTVSAWRMSHTDYFRPRAYALCDDGDIVAYTLTNDCSNIKWTTVLPAADLASAAGAGEGSVATDLQVTDDGRIAFLRYGGVWKAVANTPPVWKLRIENSSGELEADPYVAVEILNDGVGNKHGGVAYITDGKRELYCVRENWTRLRIGQTKTANAQGNAWKNAGTSEVLDFSRGYAELENDELYHDYGSRKKGLKYDIYGQTKDYLGGTASVMEPRIFIESPNLAYFYYSRGLTAVEEVVLDCIGADNKNTFTKYPECVQRLVVNLPNRTELSSGWLVQADKNALGATSFEEIQLPALTNIGVYAIHRVLALGKLDLPAIQKLADSSGWNSPIGRNVNMTEVSLGTGSQSLSYVGDRLFYYDSGLQRITFGGVSGFAIRGSSSTLFEGVTSLQDVIFTGGAPTFDDVEYVFPDTAEKQLVFAVPSDSAEWDAFIGGNVTMLTMAQQQAFREANPDRPLPHGIVAASVFRTHNPQYIAYSDKEKILRSGIRMLIR